MYKHLSKHDGSHPGQRYVRTTLDNFTISGRDGEHHCLVHKPMWDSLNELLARNVRRRFTEELLREALRRLFAALDYLHTECHVIHTGTAVHLYMLESPV